MQILPVGPVLAMILHAFVSSYIPPFNFFEKIVQHRASSPCGKFGKVAKDAEEVGMLLYDMSMEELIINCDWPIVFLSFPNFILKSALFIARLMTGSTFINFAIFNGAPQNLVSDGYANEGSESANCHISTLVLCFSSQYIRCCQKGD